MNAVFILAGLTIREAVRRRVFMAALLVAGLFLLFAFLPLTIKPNPIFAPEKLFAWLGCGTIKFFSSVLAVTLAAGAITPEVERGILSVVVPKPLSRPAIYFGKWLGLITLLAVSVAAWGILLVWAIWHQTGIFHPHIFTGILATFLFAVLFTTLTLCFSSFAGYALAAGLSLIVAGLSLAEDLLHRLSLPLVGLDSPILETLSKTVGYLVPLSRMNHWISRGLGDAGWDFSAFLEGRRTGQVDISTTNGDMVYIVCYIAFFLLAGLFIFQRRDL